MPSADYSDFIKFKRIQTEVAVSKNIDSRKKRAGAPNAGYNPSYQLQNLPPNIFTPGRLIPQPPTQEYTDGDFVFSDQALTILIRYTGDIGSVTSLEIPATTKIISESVFTGCRSLVSLEIPDGLERINNLAFSGCEKLQSLLMFNSVTYIGESAFAICFSLLTLDLSDSLQAISPYAFENCQTVEALTIPNSVTSIGEGSFRECNSLISVTLGNLVELIDHHAFSGCNKLESLSIPNSVLTIGESAFDTCTSLSTLDIGTGITSSSSIGNNAFLGCTSLTKSGLTKNFILSPIESIRIFGVPDFSDTDVIPVDFGNSSSITVSSLPSQTSFTFYFTNVTLGTTNTGLGFQIVSPSTYDFTGSTLLVENPSGYSVINTELQSDSIFFRLTTTNLVQNSTWLVTLSVVNGATTGPFYMGFD